MVPGGPGTAEGPEAKAKVAVLGLLPLSSVRAQIMAENGKGERAKASGVCLLLRLPTQGSE